MNLNFKESKVEKWFAANWEKIYTVLILCGVILTAVLMYYRCFFGTELSDEAYYASEAKEMLNGNIPYAETVSSFV